MSIRTKNTIALTCVALVFIAYGLWIYSLESRKKAVLDSMPDLERRIAALAHETHNLREPKPGEAPAGYSPYGPGPFLATCGVCKGKVSSDAKACPHCGDPR